MSLRLIRARATVMAISAPVRIGAVNGGAAAPAVRLKGRSLPTTDR